MTATAVARRRLVLPSGEVAALCGRLGLQPPPGFAAEPTAIGTDGLLQDGDVQTACQSACATGAIHFGDLADPAADVVRLRASPRHYAMLGELNTRPRTTYLARVVDKGEGA